MRNGPVATGNDLGRWAFRGRELEEPRRLVNRRGRGSFGEKVVTNRRRIRAADALACYVGLAEETLQRVAQGRAYCSTLSSPKVRSVLTKGLERANGGMEFTMFPPSTVARAKMRVYGLHAPFSSSEAVLPVPVPLLSRLRRLAVADEGQEMGCPTAEGARTRTNPAILMVRGCYTDSLVRQGRHNKSTYLA